MDHDPLPILIVLQSCVPADREELPCIHEEYWRSYEDLEQCMEPIKQLSILLESSTEATIHDMLDYFLRLLYEKLERGAKRRVGSCTVFNTFVNTFRRKLLTLLDDVEQFFLWVVAAVLDGEENQFGVVGSCLGSQGSMAECYQKIQKCVPIAVRRWSGTL